MSKSAKKMILEAFSRDFGDPKIERLKRDCPGGELVPNIGLEKRRKGTRATAEVRVSPWQ